MNLTKETKIKTFQEEILNWNSKYPWDYQWRKKYDIPFGSPKHLEMDFISMKFDLLEENMIQNAIFNSRRKERTFNTLLKPRKNDIEEKLSQDDIDDIFDDIDISKLNQDIKL